MNIKVASPQDFPIIQEIANIVWPQTFGPLMSSEILTYLIDRMYSTASLKQQTEVDNINYLLIENDGKTLGYASYELDYKQEAKLMVHRLYFLPEAQGLGLGTAALDYLSQLGIDKQQHAITLKVLHSNDKAYQYYLHYGFKKTGEDYNHIGNNYPPFLDYVLEKML